MLITKNQFININTGGQLLLTTMLFKIQKNTKSIVP